jgi:hypothetical protein
MDVGLNNRNTFEDPELKDVVFLVEATNQEYHNLWKDWSLEYCTIGKMYKQIPIPPIENISLFTDNVQRTLTGKQQLELYQLQKMYESVVERNKEIKELVDRRVNWKDISAGFWRQIGTHKNMPVCISFRFAYINGHKIAFYESTSQVAHHGMIEKYLIEKFQLTHDGYTRWNHTDATNFHNCVNSLDDLDIEPRDTTYEGNKLKLHEERSSTFIKRS